MNQVPANQTVSFSTYSAAVGNGAALPIEFMKANAKRVHRAFDMGEPVWMIVDELKMVYATQPNWKPTKTPRALAARVTTVRS